MENRQHIITRNVSQFKRVPTSEGIDNEEEEISDNESGKGEKDQEKNNTHVRPRRSQRSRIPVARLGFAVQSNLNL